MIDVKTLFQLFEEIRIKKKVKEETSQIHSFQSLLNIPNDIYLTQTIEDASEPRLEHVSAASLAMWKLSRKERRAALKHRGFL